MSLSLPLPDGQGEEKKEGVDQISSSLISIGSSPIGGFSLSLVGFNIL